MADTCYLLLEKSRGNKDYIKVDGWSFDYVDLTRGI